MRGLSGFRLTFIGVGYEYRRELGLGIFFDFSRVLGEVISIAGGTCSVFG